MKKLTLAFFTIYLFSNVSLSIGANHSDADYYKVTVSKTLGEAPTLLATENGTQSLIKQFYIRLDTEWNSSWIRIVASLLIFSLSVLPYFLPLFFIFRKLPNKSGSFVNFISRLLVWFWHCIGFVLAIISSGRFSELLSIPAGILVVATGIILRKIRFNRKKTLWRKNNPELAKKEDEQIRRAEKQVEEEQKRKTEVDLLEEQIRYYYAHLRNFCQQNEQFNKAWKKNGYGESSSAADFPYPSHFQLLDASASEIANAIPGVGKKTATALRNYIINQVIETKDYSISYLERSRKLWVQIVGEK